MIAKGDQRPAADSIHKIFAKVQHKEPCSKKNVLILTNRTDIGHNHQILVITTLLKTLIPKRIGYCRATIADSEILVRQIAPPMKYYNLPLSW